MKKFWFVFCKSDILLEKVGNGEYTIPYQEEPPTEVKVWTSIHNITPFDDAEVKTYMIDAPIIENEH